MAMIRVRLAYFVCRGELDSSQERAHAKHSVRYATEDNFWFVVFGCVWLAQLEFDLVPCGFLPPLMCLIRIPLTRLSSFFLECDLRCRFLNMNDYHYPVWCVLARVLSACSCLQLIGVLLTSHDCAVAVR
jgi:hypothetical protein